jgi:hypothetical protein
MDLPSLESSSNWRLLQLRLPIIPDKTPFCMRLELQNVNLKISEVGSFFGGKK